MSDRKLGRGLDFLIKNTRSVEEASEASSSIDVADIDLNPYQPRREFDIDSLNDLVESIRMHGVLQPIAVRTSGDRFQLISGERRWRASNELGERTIPAVIHEVDDQAMLELALIENIQREDLGPIEKAKAYRQLMREFNLTQEEVGRRLSQKRSTVANFLRLLDLPEELQGMLANREISMGHARALLAIESEAERKKVAQKAAKGHLTVRDIERLARGKKAGGGRGGKPAAPKPDLHLEAVAKRFREVIGNKVSITGDHLKGKIVIDYFGTEDLNRVLDLVERTRSGHFG